MSRKTILLALLVALAAGAAPAAAQAIDGTFNASTNGGAVYAVAVQADGKILIGGQFIEVNGVARGRLARLLPDGSLDTAFTAGTGNYPVRALAVQPDGKILVGGQFTIFNGVARSTVVRLNVDGTIDSTFTQPSIPGSGGNVANARALAVQPDGKIVVGGFFNGMLRRLNADGTADGAFAPSPNTTVYDVALQSDGRIVIGGTFTSVAGVARNRIARLNSNGSLDGTFDPNANSGVYSVAVRPDGRIVAGGAFTTIGGTPRTRAALLNTDGTLDPTFSPSVNNDVNDIAVQADGKAIIGGRFTSVGAVAARLLARLMPDGSLDQSFVAFTAGSGYVQAVIIQPDGKILAVGDYGASNVTRFLPTGPPQPPTISAPPNQSGPNSGLGQTFGPLPFVVTDPEGAPVTVSAASSNPAIVAPAGLVLGGSGTNRTITVSTVAGAVGTSTITLTASDGSLTATASFSVTITPGANQPPSISAIANQSLVDAGSGATGPPIPFAVVDPEGQPVTVSAASSNAAIIAPVGLTLGGSGASRTITISNIGAGASGTAVVTLTASDGVSTATRSFSVTVTVQTPAVQNLVSIVSRNVVTLTWQPPVTTETIIGYIVEAGFSPGGTAVSLPVGNVLSFSVSAPEGRYFVRVLAQTASGATLPASNEVELATGQSAPPLPPATLLATVAGTNVTLQWTENPLGPIVGGYQLQAGSGPGLSNLATVSLPATTRTFAATAGPGTYFVRVVAGNAAGVSAPSHEVIVTTGPGICTLPAVPANLAADIVAGGVTLSWDAPVAGGIPTGYRLEAGSVSGAANVGVFSLPPNTTLSAAAAAGTYFVRMAATNGCGASAAGPEVTVVIP